MITATELTSVAVFVLLLVAGLVLCRIWEAQARRDKALDDKISFMGKEWHPRHETEVEL